MCCLFTVLVFLGPRFGGVLWWLINPTRWVGDSNVSAFESALWPILGIIFLPWTTLMYVAVAPGGVSGIWEWLFIGLAVVIDIGAYAGGGIGNKDKLPV